MDRDSFEQLLNAGAFAGTEGGPPYFFGGNKKFLFNVMGDYLIERYGACKINGVVHVYDGGIYIPGEEYLHGRMLQLIPTLSDARRREVYKYIKVSLTTPTKEVSPPHLIPFRSRVYDLQKDRFLDYSPDMVFLNRFPYDYESDAPRVPLVDETLFAISRTRCVPCTTKPPMMQKRSMIISTSTSPTCWTKPSAPSRASA